MWNWQFEQASYNLQVANASVVLDGDPLHLNYDACNNPGYWAWRHVAYMAKHIADIFKTGASILGAKRWFGWKNPFFPIAFTVFGDDNVGYGKRVRPLLSGQVSQPLVVQSGLEYLDAVWGPPNTILHGIAGAPYFNIAGGYNNNANLTIDEVFIGFNLSSEYKRTCGYHG